MAPDGVRHEVWQVPANENQAIVDAFATIDALYIADGHHRAASAARTRRSLATKGAGEHDRVLAVAFPDDQVQILPYNRVVKDLNGMTCRGLPGGARQRFTVAQGRVADADGEGPGRDVPRAASGTRCDPKTAADALDVDVLESSILEPLLGIKDVRTDKRIDFVGGIRGTQELERLVEFRRSRGRVFACIRFR